MKKERKKNSKDPNKGNEEMRSTNAKNRDTKDDKGSSRKVMKQIVIMRKYVQKREEKYKSNMASK